MEARSNVQTEENGGNNASRELKCPSCENCSFSINSFLLHQKIHMRELRERFQYLCNLCPYSTKVMDHLRKHLMRHYSVKPFECEKCNWTCVTKHQLQVHSLKHLNLKRKRLRR